MSDEADLRGLRIPSMTEAERKIASQSSIYLGGAGNHAYGIPDRDPAPFVGAAGLTSSQQSQINNRLNDTESLGANTAAAPASPTGAGGSPPKSKVSPGNVRRGSAIHSEGLAVLGGEQLKRVRAERKKLTGGRGAKPWEDMPPAFEGAAGLSSSNKNWIDMAGADPAVRETDAQRRASIVSRMPTQDGAGGGGAARKPSPYSRRGSALHSEGFAILGSEELSKLRAERTQQGASRSPEKRRPKSASAWEGMPQTFEGAAGVPTKMSSLMVAQGDPHLRSETLEAVPRAEAVEREAPQFSGAAGLTTEEQGAMELQSQMDKPPPPRPVVGGFAAGRIMAAHASRPARAHSSGGAAREAAAGRVT